MNLKNLSFKILTVVRATVRLYKRETESLSTDPEGKTQNEDEGSNRSLYQATLCYYIGGKRL